MGEQNTHGESNPAHFSEERMRRKFNVRGRGAQPAGIKVPLGAAPCPLSAQPDRKLMQKIHRLTDN
jgi:hypothetical protein